MINLELLILLIKLSFSHISNSYLKSKWKNWISGMKKQRRKKGIFIIGFKQKVEKDYHPNHRCEIKKIFTAKHFVESSKWWHFSWKALLDYCLRECPYEFTRRCRYKPLFVLTFLWHRRNFRCLYSFTFLTGGHRSSYILVLLLESAFFNYIAFLNRIQNGCEEGKY